MSSSASAQSQPATLTSRFRNTLIAFVFATVLLIPKMLRLRQNQRSWFAFRAFLFLAGIALVLLPLSLRDSYLFSVVGLVMFVAAILLPPARTDTSVDDKARELGALVVVNGGEYQPGNAPAAAAQLFVGTDHVWALDPHFQPLLVIPVGEITSTHAEESTGSWLLRIRWNTHAAEFLFRGVFAEHLARVAENTIHGVLRPALPVLPRSRAASA